MDLVMQLEIDGGDSADAQAFSQLIKELAGRFAETEAPAAPPEEGTEEEVTHMEEAACRLAPLLLSTEDVQPRAPQRGEEMPLGEALFLELQAIEVEFIKEDFFYDGTWDLDVLRATVIQLRQDLGLPTPQNSRVAERERTEEEDEEVPLADRDMAALLVRQQQVEGEEQQKRVEQRLTEEEEQRWQTEQLHVAEVEEQRRKKMRADAEERQIRSVEDEQHWLSAESKMQRWQRVAKRKKQQRPCAVKREEQQMRAERKEQRCAKDEEQQMRAEREQHQLHDNMKRTKRRRQRAKIRKQQREEGRSLENKQPRPLPLATRATELRPRDSNPLPRQSPKPRHLQEGNMNFRALRVQQAQLEKMKEATEEEGAHNFYSAQRGEDADKKKKEPAHEVSIPREEVQQTMRERHDADPDMPKIGSIFEATITSVESGCRQRVDIGRHEDVDLETDHEWEQGDALRVEVVQASRVAGIVVREVAG